MYLVQPRHFATDQIAQLLYLAQSLHPTPGPGGAGMTPQGETRARFEPVLRPFFPQPWYACTVVGLWPSQQIPAHADAAILGVRYHLPVQTNSGCWVFHAEGWQQLAEGRVYLMDPTKPHGAVNWGSEIRLHVMIDVEGA